MKSVAYMISCLRKDFELFGESELHKLGFPRGLLYFLLFIAKHPGCSAREITMRLLMDSGHTARSLEKLETMGYIRRCVSPSDKRKWLLYTTEEGEKLVDKCRTLFREWDDEAMEELTEEERQTFTLLMEKVVRTRVLHYPGGHMPEDDAPQRDA